MDKLAKSTGAETDTVFSNMMTKAAEYTEQGMESNEAMYRAMVEQTQERQRIAQDALKGMGEGAQQYQDDLNALADAEDKLANATKKRQEAQKKSDYDEDSEEAQQLLEDEQNAATAFADAQAAVED